MIDAHTVYLLRMRAAAPATKLPRWQPFEVTAESDGKALGSVPLRVELANWFSRSKAFLLSGGSSTSFQGVPEPGPRSRLRLQIFPLLRKCEHHKRGSSLNRRQR